jgi:hypothetical protein
VPTLTREEVTIRGEGNTLYVDTKKEIIMRLKKGLQNEEPTDGSWKVCSRKILCNRVKMCVVVVSKTLVTRL